MAINNLSNNYTIANKYTTGTTSTISLQTYYPYVCNYAYNTVPINWDVDYSNNKVMDKKQQQQKKGKRTMSRTTSPVADSERRLVSLVIYDPDERVPDEKAMLHRSDVFVTTKTDEELFLELDMKGMVDRYNIDVRCKIVDEERSDVRHQDVFLKPVRVSDLERVVVEY